MGRADARVLDGATSPGVGWLIVAAVSGALAVGFGAFGAHGLSAIADPQGVASWDAASGYHLLHSVVLLALALFGMSAGRSVALPAGLLSVGVLLFSGSIYLLVLTGWSWLGPVTPLGGLCLIAGWLALLRLANKVRLRTVP